MFSERLSGENFPINLLENYFNTQAGNYKGLDKSIGSDHEGHVIDS